MSVQAGETPPPAQRCQRSCFQSRGPRPFFSHTIRTNKELAASELFARLVSAAIIWCDVITIGRGHREIASALRLRFAPLEIFAQRQFQPILARIIPWFLRSPSGLALVFILLTLHREPARMTGTKPDRRNSYCVSLAVRAIADSWATRD